MSARSVNTLYLTSMKWDQIIAEMEVGEKSGLIGSVLNVATGITV